MSRLTGDLLVNNSLDDIIRITTSDNSSNLKSSPGNSKSPSNDEDRLNHSYLPGPQLQNVEAHLNVTDQNSSLPSNKKREVYRHQTDFLISSVAWCNNNDGPFLLALSSLIDEYVNYLQLVSLKDETFDQEIIKIAQFEHPYPATKLCWIPQPPDHGSRLPKLLATSGDYLRLWKVLDNSDRCDGNESMHYDIKLESLLNSNKESADCAPLTSFDWNDVDPTTLLTSSVDGSCALWNVEVGRMSYSVTNDKPLHNLRGIILAHDKEVYDVSFSKSGNGQQLFITCGGDGLLRQFDVRCLGSSAVLFESVDKRPLVRVACNKRDPNLISAFTIDSKELLLIDQRYPGRLSCSLSCHTSNLNTMSWAPHSAHHICSAGDDSQALIWDLSKFPQPIDQPLLAYKSSGKINTASWSAAHPEWISIGFENNLELLRV